MRKIFYIIIGIILFSLFIYYLNVDLDLKDNYYLAINKEVIDNKRKENIDSFSYFIEAQDRVLDNVDLIVKEILEDKDNILSDKEVSTIKGIYNKVIDIDKRNNDGIKDLESYINKVFGVENVDELVDVIILVENDLGIDLLSNIEVMEDYSDNSRNIIYLYPVTYSFNVSSDYIVNDDYMTYKAYIRRACVELWKAYGYSDKDARRVVGDVFDFYEKVSNESLLNSDLSEIDSYYNIISEDDLNSLYSNTLGKYLYGRGINNYVYSIVDMGQYKYLNDSLISDNLSTWKYVVITKILSSYASYGSSDYLNVVNNLNKAILASDKDDGLEKQAIDIINGMFSSEVDRLYQSKYLDSDTAREIEDMFFCIKDVFKIRIKNNKWLSESAKEMALLKLDNMDIIIGEGDTLGYNIASGLEVSDDSLIKDIININKLIRNDDLERLKTGEKRNLISQTTVNAYYQVLDNSIVIPISFFTLIEDYDSYYELLGTMGMIIAHEVTHAFDGNGSKFDYLGNLNNWWNESDYDNFKKLKNSVSDYYSKYEVLNGKYIDGEKTVNENIADLGGVSCIVDVAINNDASEDDIKLMFSSYARMWASYYSDDYMKLLLLQDVHSPNEFRVNAVLSSIDEFYDIYNVYFFNDMWLDKEKRVLVW